MEYHSTGLTEVEKPDDLFRVAFIERKHKRRITNFNELVEQCNQWQLPEGTKYTRVECWSINLDDPNKYLENISQLRSVDALVSICSLLGVAFIVTVIQQDCKCVRSATCGHTDKLLHR